MFDKRRLLSAFAIARDHLLDQRAGEHWVGELSASALSTATAVSALAMLQRFSGRVERREVLIGRGVRWLLNHQNDDGGWGDTDRNYSNVSTTMLVKAALHLSGRAEEAASVVGLADEYLRAQGGIEAIRRRYGTDKTFAVPILTNAALAGLVPWREVSPLPFELACLPQPFYRFLRLPVVSYAIPALVAIGQAKYHHDRPWDPLRRAIRSAATGPSLKVLLRMQPDSGGYLEAVPLTSFVLMSLASIGNAEHEVSRRGEAFIEASVRADGSWPIDTNLATWNTTLAINALSTTGDLPDVECLDWLLKCQHLVRHSFTGAEPGGWGWSDLSGAVPDADDTPGALLALNAFARGGNLDAARSDRVRAAARAGVEWLLALQNVDGGWPTFCRGWGKLPFDRSGDDLTAHALRALHAWRDLSEHAIREATERALRHLARRRRAEGCWVPLWFGNQERAGEENPVYGTAKVLKAYVELGRLADPCITRAIEWLSAQQNEDGGWGNVAVRRGGTNPVPCSGVEETALAVESLLPFRAEAAATAVDRGIEWLVRAVESGRYLESSPIGLYFAKLWYYEKLYPVLFTVSALGLAAKVLATGMSGTGK